MAFDWKCAEVGIPKQVRPYYRTYWTIPDTEVPRVEAEFESKEPDYTSEDVQAANILHDTQIRRFILRIAQVTKVREKDATELVKQSILKKLMSMGLLREEYLLTCKQDQHTICVVSNRVDLTKDPMSSARCSLCGRLFPDENLQVIYTLSELCRKLVQRSLWMSIWVTELLRKNGVMRESIQWGLEANGEELDILVEDFDSRIFFELKDREFGLGDSYPFVYRLYRYGGTVGIVATMDKVSADAGRYFKEETERRDYPVEMYQLEGSSSIQQGIPKLVEAMALRKVRRLIEPFASRIGLDLWPIAESWINTKMLKRQ